MYRTVLRAGMALSVVVCSTQASEWSLSEPSIIDENGARPCLWSGTIAYLSGGGGPVMYFDGQTTELVNPAFAPNWEPVNANGSVAWRQTLIGTSNKEIFRWDGQYPIEPVNISQSELTDNFLAAAGNGDLIWSRDNSELVYYNAADGVTTPLGIAGIQPSLYVPPGGTPTYAYMDPDTNLVHYFDGVRTHTIGMAAPGSGYPSLWNGCVAWIGRGEGGYFESNEIFVWKNGRSIRITNNNENEHILDQNPRVWNDLVVWSRSIDGFTNPPVLMLWDGNTVTPLTERGGAYPSFHDAQIAWEDEDAMVIADLIHDVPGDCNGDGTVDLEDYVDFENCMLGPKWEAGGACDCFDVDGNHTVDLADFTRVQIRIEADPVPGDCNGDAIIDAADYAEFAFCLTGPGQPTVPGCNCLDYDGNNQVDLLDFVILQEWIGDANDQ